MDAIELTDTAASAADRGAGEGSATDLTGYLVGLPSLGLRWTILEVEAIQRLRLERERAARAARAAAEPA